jgi:polysaccharide biosynthesis protein PslG
MRWSRRQQAVIATATLVAVILVVVAVTRLAGSGGRQRPARASTSSTTSTPTPTAAPTTSTPTTTAPTSSTTTATSAAPAPALPAPATQELGANVNLIFYTPHLAPSVMTTQLRALRATGATVARADALWEASEPSAPVAGVHHYDWSYDDQIASLLAAAGLRWLPVLDYTAWWAQSIPGQDHSPPRSASDYAAYAGAFAARYGSGGAFWAAHPELTAEPVSTIEIWNEPDNGQFWTRTPDAAAYADLYAAARLAIDAADPAARVIVGGLTRPTEFLPAMLAARPGLAGHIDGVAVHPYGSPPVVAAKVAADRAMLTGAGLGAVPLYATEFGWTTSPPGALDYVAAPTRPGYIRRTLHQLRGRWCGVAAAVLYTWYSPEQNAADSQQWYGIDGPTGAPTADSVAFTAGVRGAGAAHASRRPCG